MIERYTCHLDLLGNNIADCIVLIEGGVIAHSEDSVIPDEFNIKEVFYL